MVFSDPKNNPMTPNIGDMLQQIWKTLFPADKMSQLKDEGSKAWSDITNTASDAWKKMNENIAELDKNVAAANAANVTYEECPVVDSQKLFAVARSIRAEGANGIAVYYERTEDGAIVENLYLANVKERELLPAETNKYAIIKAKALTADVLGLFLDSKLVILK